MGAYTWTSTSNVPALSGLSGAFTATVQHPPGWRGKLRVHPEDPTQFATDDGAWFLHLGDTGYRFLHEDERNWKRYLDQAVQVRDRGAGARACTAPGEAPAVAGWVGEASHV